MSGGSCFLWTAFPYLGCSLCAIAGIIGQLQLYFSFDALGYFQFLGILSSLEGLVLVELLH